MKAATNIIKGKSKNEILKMEPLKFWKDNQLEFPRLVKVAVEVLATPIQSAASERVFTRVTRTINPHTVMLDPDRDAALVRSAYRHNSRLLKDQRWGYNRNRAKLSKDKHQQIIFPPYGTHDDSLAYIDYEL